MRGAFGVVGGCVVEAAVGAVRVVVLEVPVEESAELALVPDEGSVEEFVARGAYPALSVSVGVRIAGGVGMTSAPTAANTLSTVRVNWPARSRITKRDLWV